MLREGKKDWKHRWVVLEKGKYGRVILPIL